MALTSGIAGRSSGPLTLGRISPVVAVTALVAGIAAGGLPTLYGAALLVATVGAVIVLVNPILGLVALTVVIPLSPANETIGNLPLTPTDAVVALTLVSAATTRMVRRQANLRVTGAFWPGVCFLVVGVLSAAFAPDLLTSAKDLVRQIEMVTILVIAATFCQSRSDRLLVVVGLLVGLIAESLLGWVQFLLRRGPESFQIGPFLRAYGTFGQPNPFAGYIVMTAPIALALTLWLGPWTRRPRTALLVLAVAASGISGIALLMSLSRGALFGLIGGVLVLIAAYSRRGGTILALVVAAALAVVFLGSTHLIPAAVSDRLGQVTEYLGWFDAASVEPTPANWAVVERMAHWNAAWNMYIANPILGVGPGHYPTAYPIYQVNDFWNDPLGHAHNIYLNIMAELGILGIIAYVGELVAWTCVVVAAFRRAQEPFDRALAVGVLASLLGVAVHNIFDNLSVHGLGTETGLLIGLCAAIGFSTADRERELR